MDKSSKRELVAFYFLFLGAMLAGFFYAQKSTAQIRAAKMKLVSLRKPSSLSDTPTPSTPTLNSPPTSPAPSETLTFIPALPMPSFEIKLVDPYTQEFGFGILDFITGFTSTRITSLDKNTQGTASLVTRDNVEVGLRYRQLFTPSFRTIFAFDDRRLDFIQPNSGVLANPSINLFSFSAGAQYNFAKNFSATLLVGSEQVPFLKGVSLTQVTMDQLSVPDAALYLSWDIMDRHPFQLGAEGFVKTYFPASSDIYQSNTNLGFGGRFFVRQDVNSKLRVDLGVGAQYLNQNTTIVNQQQTDYGIDLKISIPIGGSFR
jgi:hypothetical protein